VRQPRPARALHRERRVLDGSTSPGKAFFKHANKAYQDWAIEIGIYDAPQSLRSSALFVEPLRKFQLAAEGTGISQPPEHLRARIEALLRPAAPSGIRPSRTDVDINEPIRSTRSPSGRCTCTIPGARRTPG
jgi:hypothetical protein